MKLLTQSHSPFARKVELVIHELELDVTTEHVETSPTRPNPEIFAVNPLGKVPVLLEEGRPPLFDSAVICAYLDERFGRNRFHPIKPDEYWHAVTVQSVAQGMNEAGIQLRWETVRRPVALRYEPLRDGYIEKLECSYDWLERELDVTGPPDIGHLAVAAALDWLEFRELPSFRGRPRLTAWFDSFRSRPSMQRTQLHGDTHD